MPSVVQSPIGGNGQQFLDASGVPLSGGLLYSYAAGTTTPLTTYTSVLGTVANANPIVLGSDGRVASGGVWLVVNVSYKFVIKTSAGVTVNTWDNVTGITGRSLWYSVTDYGAVGDGSTDDTTTINTTIAAANTAGGGTVWFPEGNYKVTAALTALGSGVTLKGETGSKVTIATTASVATWLSTTGGSQGSAIALTVNVAAGDKTVTMGSTTGLAASDYVYLRDLNRAGGYYPFEILQIESLTATTVTFLTPVSLPYAIANTTQIRPLTFITDVAIEGMAFEFAATAEVTTLLRFDYVRGLRVKDCRVNGHRVAAASLASQVGIDVNQCYDVEIADNFLRSKTGTGVAIRTSGCGFARIDRCQMVDYSFGLDVIYQVGGHVSGCFARGVAVNGNRGLKCQGTQFLTFEGNHVIGFDSGIKFQDSGRGTIVDNEIASCIGTGINVSHANALTGDNGWNTIANNRIKSCAAGISLVSTDTYTSITGNTVEICTTRAIHCFDTDDILIANNYVYNWGTAYPGGAAEGYAGITFRRRARVMDNVLIHTDAGLGVNGFYIDASAITAVDGTAFVGNVSPTKGFVSLTDVSKIGLCHGNAVASFSQKIARVQTASAPTVGTWEAGDRAYVTDPVAGGHTEFVCVTGGGPGTWKQANHCDLDGTVVWDPGNLVDGAGETSSAITVTGAALGDFAIPAAPYDLQGITATAYVSATDTLRIRIQNETGGAIDLASGTWKVRVIKA